MLLHYHVVPGLGDGIGSRPEATAVRGDEVALTDCGEAAIPVPTAEADAASPIAETLCAA